MVAGKANAAFDRADAKRDPDTGTEVFLQARRPGEALGRVNHLWEAARHRRAEREMIAAHMHRHVGPVAADPERNRAGGLRHRLAGWWA